MAGVDLGVVGQMEQALDDVGAELLVVAPREVGAANAAAEERVAGEDPPFDFGVEADAAHGMARRADDLQGALSHLDDFAVLKVAVRQLALTHKRHSKQLRLLTRTQEVVFHIGMRRHGDAVTLFHCHVAHNMVHVSVRIDGQHRLEAMAVDETEELVCLAISGAARVDDDTFFGTVVVNDIGIFRKGIEYEGIKFKHNYVFRGKGRDFSAVF